MSKKQRSVERPQKDPKIFGKLQVKTNITRIFPKILNISYIRIWFVGAANKRTTWSASTRCSIANCAPPCRWRTGANRRRSATASACCSTSWSASWTSATNWCCTCTIRKKRKRAKRSQVAGRLLQIRFGFIRIHMCSIEDDDEIERELEHVDITAKDKCAIQ